MSVRTVRSMRSMPTIRRSLHSSSAAPNPSHLLSSQQDTVRTHFTTFTVPALKQECRQRGLKLSGRKVDLIDRLVGFERAQSFSSSAPAPAPRIPELFGAPIRAEIPLGAKPFSATVPLEIPASIDAYEVPSPAAHSGPDPHVVSKIPVTEGHAVEQISTKGVSSDTGASAGDVHVVDGSSQRVSTMNVDLGDGAPQHDEEKLGHKPTNRLSSGDKKFLWGLGALIAVWWSSPEISISSTAHETH